MQYPEVAREFLEMFLPEDLKKQLDFNSITHCTTHFLDEEFKLTQSDVLFKCHVSNQEAYLYILAEHEDKVDPLISYWLLKYLVGIWDWHIKEQSRLSKALPLPATFPSVFYTGDRPYTACRHLWELFGEQNEQMRAILQSTFHLVEAGKIPEEMLTSHVYAGTMGFIMRKHFRKQLERELLKIMGNLNQLDSGGYHRFVIDLLSYVLGIDEGHQKTSELVSLI